MTSRAGPAPSSPIASDGGRGFPILEEPAHGWVRQIFLWTNPLFFREESYALPHHVHHAQTEGPGDPYGPHPGRLASFVALETTQRTRTSAPSGAIARS
jgi:hypothetical protein